MSGFDILPCKTCENTWLQESGWQAHDTVSCPHCGSERATNLVKIRGSQETKARAAELRSRIEAGEADESDIYERFIEDRGQYAEQHAEVEQQIDSFTLDADKMDLTPIESDRYDTLAKTVLEPGRRKFEEWADEYSGIGVSAFEDEISLENPEHEICQEYVDDALDGWSERADRDAHARGSITVTETQPVSSVTTVELGSTTVTEFWNDLFQSTGLQQTLADAIGSRFGNLDANECYDELQEMGVPFWLRTPIAAAVNGQTRSIWQLVTELTPTLSANPLAATEDLLTVASLFGALEEDPTVAVVVREPFVDPKQVRRDQRVDICDLLSVLAAGLDLQLVGSPNTLQKVADRHRSDLDGFSEWCNQDRASEQIEDTASAARRVLDPDGRKVRILRQLAAQPDQVLARADIEAEHDVTTARISQLLRNGSDSLTALGLVSVYGPDGGQMVALQAAGQLVLEQINADAGRQSNISDLEFFSGNSYNKCRVTPQEGVGGEDGQADQPQAGRPYRTDYASPSTHHAAAACARNGAVTVVRGDVEHENGLDGKVRLVSYDDERDEAVVAIQAAEPLPYTTTLAAALASEEFIDRALPVDRLEDITEPPSLLRDVRNIGGLSAHAASDAQQLRDNLVEWGRDVQDMTTALRNEDYQDRDRFRGSIIRSAHGLAGSIAHLLETVGIDLVREIRVPGGRNIEKQLRPLAKSIGISAAIQSEYRKFAPYRQLFDVPDCDKPPVAASIDAETPTGDLIGSFVIRGPDVHRFRDDLEHFLETPRETLDDAPAFSIDIRVRDPKRADFGRMATRILAPKNIGVTDRAVSILNALVATPHDIADALQRRLEPEDDSRQLRPDELRVALRGVDADAFVPELPRSVGKLLSVLLAADDSLSQKRLAELADVTARTVRNHAERLQSLSLVSHSSSGWRLSLSFPTRQERNDPVIPALTTADGLLIDAADGLLETMLPPDRYADPDDPAGSTLYWPQNPRQLLEIDEFESWISIALRLLGEQPGEKPEKLVSMGPAVRQQAITEAAAD
ncbi:hypothetical protein [Natronorubrum daqingense]|uniref:Uncharacterized protein n=1 Tax=Natronorubrum daqingense TaxID=588898 RepID=A0A1N7G4N4_9EURY|nr:hypothetical protein [Natronorubrum daqingense]APX98737.1 hypothetical protein BB347_18705 [Natronorubrum daqingense]SIS07508.1 hypothetical protein SAMN05421809_3717 [Natronorubrum daqingense]